MKGLVDVALLVVPGAIWGASFLFIAEGLTAMAPNGVTFTRIAIGFLTLSLFPSARKPVARSDWAGTAALGVLWLAFPLSMFPFAEQRVSSALTGMLNGATPLFVAAVASVIAHRLPSRGTMAGLIIGFGGAVIMALPALGGSSSAVGVGLICAALVSY
ncbi:MAG TPA: DMT family transporter, partial [Vicinamibacterales bacterium]|nr:DMT family transporter [Vicinamibacterales bacterium]